MNTPIKTGIIGFGLSGQVFHAPFLHVHEGFEIRKVVERNDEKSKAIYPYVKVVKDYMDLIRDPEIDLIVHCTPNIYHFPYVKACLEAGKHVVIEKPFTPTAKEADELISIAESKDLKIFVYQNRRWDGDFLTIKKVLESGELGQIHHYEAHFDRYSPKPTRALWREDVQPGSGNLYDLGSHLIDQALQLFGQPESLSADIQSQRDNTIVDDYFKLNLKYTNKEAVLTAGMLVKDIGPRYIIRGSKGTFTKYGIDPQEAALKQGLMPDSENWGVEDPQFYGTLTFGDSEKKESNRIKTEPGNYMGFYDNVYDVIINSRELAVKPVEARNVIALIEQAREISKFQP